MWRSMFGGTGDLRTQDLSADGSASTVPYLVVVIRLAELLAANSRTALTLFCRDDNVGAEPGPD